MGYHGQSVFKTMVTTHGHDILIPHHPHPRPHPHPHTITLSLSLTPTPISLSLSLTLQGMCIMVRKQDIFITVKIYL